MKAKARQGERRAVQSNLPLTAPLSLSESDFCCYYRTPKTGKFVKKRGLFNTQFRRFRNMGLLLVFVEDLMVDVIPW